jgi:hypothetical protein
VPAAAVFVLLPIHGADDLICPGFAVSFATEQLDHIICSRAVCDVMYLLLVSDRCCWIDAAYHCAVGATPALGVALCAQHIVCCGLHAYMCLALLCARGVLFTY